jgi:hypothetical protein
MAREVCTPVKICNCDDHIFFSSLEGFLISSAMPETVDDRFATQRRNFVIIVALVFLAYAAGSLAFARYVIRTSPRKQ